MRTTGCEIIFNMISGFQGQTSLDLRCKTDMPKSTVEYHIRNMVNDGTIVAVDGGKLRRLYSREYAKDNGLLKAEYSKDSSICGQLLFNQLMGAI